jgi:glutamyl-Q tRNA(Asp) synthetase
MEGPLFRRSSQFVEAWLASLAKPAPVMASTFVTSKERPKKHHDAVQPEEEGSSMSKINFVVGRVVDVKPHPESQKLYIEQIDIGEATGPRTILSGLQEHISINEFLDQLVVVVANLEPRKIGGIPSAGMVLCASSEGKNTVELLRVPLGTPVGERLTFPGHEQPPAPVLKKKLAKCYEEVAPLLRTDGRGVATWNGIPFKSSAGFITSSIVNGVIS